MFGKVEAKGDKALTIVDIWDTKEKSHPLSLEELEARKEANDDYKN